MKKLFGVAAFMLCLAFVSTLVSCKKKTSDSTCKTCRAFGTSGQVAEKKVCSESEETKFRADYPDKEISCTN